MAELVGILNLTPDSFSDGGAHVDPIVAIEKADRLFTQGASIIDIGAESTRRGAIPLTADEEWSRLEPVLPTLIQKYPGKISLDSYHPENILRASEIGSVIANDVTSFCNPHMREVAAATGSICIVSHTPSAFEGDIQAAHWHRDASTVTVRQVWDELYQRTTEMVSEGISRDKIVWDPGIGFGKTKDVDRALVSFARLVPDHDVMVGYSNKLGRDTKTNLMYGKIALLSEAKYLRVHDVAAHYKLLLTLGQL